MEDELLEKFAAINGSHVQMLTTLEIKLIEEMAELTQAICKQDMDHIKEELADTKIMLSQYILYLKDDETIKNWEKKKLQRQRDRFKIR